jgi:hypothetical protein
MVKCKNDMIVCVPSLYQIKPYQNMILDVQSRNNLTCMSQCSGNGRHVGSIQTPGYRLGYHTVNVWTKYDEPRLYKILVELTCNENWRDVNISVSRLWKWGHCSVTHAWLTYVPSMINMWMDQVWWVYIGCIIQCNKETDLITKNWRKTKSVDGEHDVKVRWHMPGWYTCTLHDQCEDQIWWA